MTKGSRQTHTDRSAADAQHAQAPAGKLLRPSHWHLEAQGI
jgi:hypothetical protein